MQRERLLRFHESFAKELEAKKDRLRDLIADTNWGEDGRYKEILLRSVMQPYVPDPYYVDTGFFISSDGNISKQIDVIIRDGTVPVYFKEGDFVVVPQQAVVGFIEVKTNIGGLSDLGHVLSRYRNLYSGRVINSAVFLADESREIEFKGLFAYDVDRSVDLSDEDKLQQLKNILASSEVAFNHIVLGQKYFIKYWPREREYCIYELQNLSYTYFLSNLLEVLSKFLRFPFREQLDFRYPILKDRKLLGCASRNQQLE